MTGLRHALYLLGPDAEWDRLGAGWLGWDLLRGMPSPQIAPDLPRPLAELTRTPARYGFHATLVAPFRLAARRSPEALAHHVADLLGQGGDGAAGAWRPIPVGRADIRLMGRMLAFRFDGAANVSALEARLVRGLDGWRAPLDASEIARRRPERLTERQRANMMRHGYPHVLEDFRLHMTLTGGVRPDEVAPVTQAARDHFAHCVQEAVHLTRVALCEEIASAEECHGSKPAFRAVRVFHL